MAVPRRLQKIPGLLGIACVFGVISHIIMAIIQVNFALNATIMTAAIFKMTKFGVRP